MPVVRLDTDQRPGVAGILLDRPEARNALSPELMVELADVVMRVGRDPDVRAIVIAATEGSPFSAGYDLDAILATGGLSEADELVERCAAAIEACPKPVLAKIRGHCLGAAVELALSCDLRICGSDARFAVPAARFGFVLPLHYAERLVGTVGASAAARLVLLGDRVAATEALRLGLVHAVVEGSELDRTVEEWIDMLSESSPSALTAAKRGLRSLRRPEHPDPEGRRPYLDLLAEAAKKQDHIEGIAAFKEGRPPRFSRPR